jgi:hypothetical protein
MNEFIPFILILIGWHPDHPGEFEFKRVEIVFPSLEECELHGNEAIEQRKIYKTEFGGTNYVFRCIPSASGAETDEAWSDLKEKLDAERASKP